MERLSRVILTFTFDPANFLSKAVGVGINRQHTRASLVLPLIGYTERQCSIAFTCQLVCTTISKGMIF